MQVEPFLLAAGVGVAMVPQDIIGTSLVVAEAHGLKFWPGLFDAAGDLIGTYGTIFAALAGVKYGVFAWQTLMLVVTKMLVSYNTTNRVAPWIGPVLKLRPMGDHPWRQLASALWRKLK